MKIIMKQNKMKNLALLLFPTDVVSQPSHDAFFTEPHRLLWGHVAFLLLRYYHA